MYKWSFINCASYKKMKQKLITLLLTATAVLLSGAEYQLSNIKLTLANKKYQSAYDELKYHLELAAGKLAPGKDALEIIPDYVDTKQDRYMEFLL